VVKFPTYCSILLATMAFLAAPAWAERHVWLVPGTAGTPFEGLGWDPAAGRIIAASGDAVLRIDPVTGEREALHRTPGPKVLGLVVGPEGIDFLQEGPVPGQADGRIRRLADGTVQVIAGRGDAGPFIGEAKDAREARFQPRHLCAGPGGLRYVSDWEHNRVLVLEPEADGLRSRIFAGAERGEDPGYDAREFDLDDGFNGPIESSFLDADPDSDPLRAAIKPLGVAAWPDGRVFLADWSEQGRPPQVIHISPDDTASNWECWRLPVPGLDTCLCPPDEEELPVRKPRLLAAGEDDSLYVLGSSHIWAYKLEDEDENGEAYEDETWYREAVAGPLAPLSVEAAWPPQGAPADQLDPAILGRIRHMAVLPDGSLLLSDGVDGIRCIGPEGDGALAARVRNHARAREHAVSAAGPEARALELKGAWNILAGLERQRDDWRNQCFDLPFRRVCNDHTVDRRFRLPGELLEHIASFLVVDDPRQLAFRAAMAAQAIRAGADPGPGPAARTLAQRHAWLVPGSVGLRVDAIHWDPPKGALVVATGREIRRLDPARRSIALLVVSPAAAPADVIRSLVVGPEGLIDFTVGGKEEGSDQVSGFFRLDPKGKLRQLTPGPASGACSGTAMATEALAGDPGILAVGPGGERYGLDEESCQVGLLTVEPGADRFGWRSLHPDNPDSEPCRLTVGEHGEVVLDDGGEAEFHRLVPQPGKSGPTWRLEHIPACGTEGCSDVYVPTKGNQTREDPTERSALAPGQAGAFYVAETNYILEYAPGPGPGPGRWRCRVVTVSPRHALPRDMFDTDPRSTLPVPFELGFSDKTMAGIPGGALALAVSGRSDGIVVIGPPGDGALFKRVRDFRKADRSGKLDRARRILRELDRQRRLTPAEVCDLPLLGICATPGGVLPDLSRQLQREVGSYLTRPEVVPFRAGLAVAAIIAWSPWAKTWVEAGCPEGPAAGSGQAEQGRQRRRVEIVPGEERKGEALQTPPPLEPPHLLHRQRVEPAAPRPPAAAGQEQG